MIQLDIGPQGTVTMTGESSPVVRWEVWFRTLRGLHTTLAEALMNAAETDMPPELIRPVTVAIAENGHYEEVIR